MEGNEEMGGGIDGQMEIKVEPTLRCYSDDAAENGFVGFDNPETIPSSADVGALNLWTSKATNCLISLYKKYRSSVGQTNNLRSLREMFEMISVEMRNRYGLYFSPQKCENKWRVLERKYKNLVFRERLKKPGRMRHYGHWEHKRALDEIFNEKKRHMYLDESDYPLPSGSTKYLTSLPKQRDADASADHTAEDPLSSLSSNAGKTASEDQRLSLTTLFEKFLDEVRKNVALVEQNKERRHKEEMLMRQNELEVQKKLLRLKEEKMELQKCQVVAAAQHLHLNMQ